MKKKVFLTLLLALAAIICVIWLYLDIILSRTADHYLNYYLLQNGISDIDRGSYSFSRSKSSLSFLTGKFGSKRFKLNSIEVLHQDPVSRGIDSVNLDSLEIEDSIKIEDARVDFRIKSLSPIRLRIGAKKDILFDRFSAELRGSLVMEKGRLDFPEVRINKIDLKLNSGENFKFSSEVKVSGLDLSKVLALYGQGGNLEVSGSIDLEFPFTDLSLTKKSIENGSLLGSSGSIKWPYDGSDIGSSYGEFARRALENFQFKEMAGTFSLSPSGDLKLKLNLKGESPGLDKNRPVHLNLNLEENLPALAESLRLLNRFPRELAKKHVG